MTKFLYDGDTVFMRSDMSMNMKTTLDAGTYAVAQTQSGEFFLKRRSDMELPEKIYGSPEKQADRIINTTLDRNGSTGVLLAGEKGSGKTLLGKILTHKARVEHSIPTIIINTPFCGEGFNRFIEAIEQPAIIFFDEFEKVYDHNELQESLLTLFDGTYTSQKLFVLTTNDRFRINSHMQNRPGRLFYFLEYRGLEESFVREYCEDNLKDKTQIESIVKLTVLFDHFNFDMLQALVQEMNRYNEDVNQALQWINIQLADSKESKFEVEVSKGGSRILCHSLGKETSFSVMHGLELRYADNKEIEKLMSANDNSKKAVMLLAQYRTNAKHSSQYFDNAFDEYLDTDEDYDEGYPDNVHNIKMTIQNLTGCENNALVLYDNDSDITVTLKPVYEYSRNGIPQDFLM